MSEAARQARLSRPAGSPPTIALAGDVDAASLRAAGWSLRGVLSVDPYVDRLGAATYVEPQEVLDDPRLDAVAVDGSDPHLARLVPELRGSGLLLLLPSADPQDVDLVRAARAVPGAADACVGLLRRWEPWAVTVSAALPLAGGPVVQGTVRGWPRGRQEAAELVDLVGAWCGEVVAVVAAPTALPASHLPGGAAVSWALLTASGATVLVSHEGQAPLVRLSFAAARLEAGSSGVRWTGGAALPLLAGAPGGTPRSGAVPHAAVGVRSGVDDRLVSVAAALLPTAGGSPVGASSVGAGDVPASWPWPADLGDLLVAARVLEALRCSARTEQPVPVA